MNQFLNIKTKLIVYNLTLQKTIKRFSEPMGIDSES